MAFVETPTVSIGGGHRLRADAARQWKLMNAAFKKARGHDIPITSSTRTLARQDYLYQGWIKRLPGFNLALPAGMSTHNYGTAFDAGGDAGIAGTADHDWLVKHGPAYGWFWTGQNFSYPESWHFDFKAGRATITATSSPSQTAEAEEEDEEMAIKQIHYKDGGTYHSAITDTASGYWLAITSGSNDTMNEIYEKWDTTLSAEVSKSVWEAAERAAAAVRAGK